MTTDQPDAPSKPHYPKRKIPPLVWILVAIMVGWLVIFLVQRDGVIESPSGGTHPVAAPREAISPATPATPDAPGAPATSNAD